MFNVLLVDDEPLVRHHLSTLTDWNRHGFDLSGEAYNGAMALSMIEQSPPHIAIIDVNMPEMDGVELNRAIRERFPAVKTIMLSSYDDYDYVRECLRNGAVDYLLKHRLDDTSLLSSLNKAVQELQREDRRHARPAGEMAERTDLHSIRDCLADMARGKPDTVHELERIARKNGMFAQAACYVTAAVQIVPFLLLTESYSDAQTNRMVRQAVDIVQQSLGDILERPAAYVEDGRLVVVLAFRERSEHAVASEAVRLMGKLQHSLELYLNLKSIYAVGHICGKLSQIGASYAAAVRILDNSPSTEPASRIQPRHSLTIEEQKQLLLSIERLDEEAMHQLIASIFATIRRQPVHSHAVQMIVREFLQLGDKAIAKCLRVTDTTKPLPSRDDLKRIGSVEELEQWLRCYYADLLKLLKQHQVSGSYSRHVSQAIQYIQENYSGNVTLELAAGAIGLNPSYLSRIFKEETRSTFSEYVNRVRIDAGRRLLESGRYSVKEISNRVGFSTYNYFFKVFKELTGMTPHAYVNSFSLVKR
ncbi:response regulator [Cohnella pontilimi]|uniref:Response regulator n=1 Tax=Cohnella pontilimi TaxID=2564100 RepID=A0A4U0FBV6_9BACL|nr:response regulator [Cohnella pontilimi]TJY42326.1 response regulator [Cohnella pontilimi]